MSPNVPQVVKDAVEGASTSVLVLRELPHGFNYHLDPLEQARWLARATEQALPELVHMAAEKGSLPLWVTMHAGLATEADLAQGPGTEPRYFEACVRTAPTPSQTQEPAP